MMWIFVDAMYLLLILVGLMLLDDTRNRTNNLIIKGLVVHFMAGTLLLGISRLAFTLTERGILGIDDSTLMIVWHVIFFCAIWVFLLASRLAVNLVNRSGMNESVGGVFMWDLGLIALAVILLGVAKFIDPVTVAYFKDSWVDRLGVLHFIAFVFAGWVAYYLFKLKTHFEGGIGRVGQPWLLAVGVLSAIHLWELLTESWRIVSLPPGVVEGVERLLWIPAFGLLVVAWGRFKALVESNGAF